MTAVQMSPAVADGRPESNPESPAITGLGFFRRVDNEWKDPFAALGGHLARKPPGVAP